MRKLYPDNQQTQEIFNRDDNRATKQDIQDLSNQIAATNQTLQNTIDALSTLSDSLSQSLNTNEITALSAAINMLQTASANITNANATNLTVSSLATLNELTANVATLAHDLTVGGNVSISGDVSANDATFDNLTATSATIANFTIDHFEAVEFESDRLTVTSEITTTDLEVTDTATIKDANVTNADIDDADITKADVEEAEIGLAKIDETAIENIHWLYWQTYTSDSPKLFMVLPHFENGIYFLRAKDGNQNTLFAVEVHNSVDNLFARWSQKEMNWVYKISKVGTGASTQCMLEVHNVDNVAFNLEYATICATPNVPAPTTYTTQPYPGNPMYKVSHQDGNKFFQNVDLANEGTTGAGLTMYATSNHALATTYYNYDGTMGVMSYNYLPNQSLNKEDNVEFYGLNVHDFSTENLNVPGTFKGKHIYDGPTLTAAQKAALPDETLLIEESHETSYFPYAFTVAKTRTPTTMSDFYDGWKWSDTFTRAEARVGLTHVVPAGSIVDYTSNSIEEDLVVNFNYKSYGYEQIPPKYIVKSIETNSLYVIFYANNFGIGAGQLESFRGQALDYHVDPSTHELVPIPFDNDSFGTGDNPNNYWYHAMDSNDEPMSDTIFSNLHTGDTFTLRDADDEDFHYIVVEDEIYIGRTTDVPYRNANSNAKLTRKTTKSGAVQVKPIVPYNENGTSATDDRPLVYDSTSDTIKKATSDISLPGDLAVAGDETVTGDLTVAGDLNAKNVEFDGNIKAEDLILTGDLEVENDAMFRHDVSISGDLYVDGVEHVNDSETTQSSGDYMILRHNNPIPLGSDEKSGIAVHNYKTGGTATMSVDKDGTWRIADNTATSVMHNNLYYFNGHYYNTSFVEQTFVDQIKTAFDEDEIGDCVFYNSDSFYHFDGTHWYAVTLVNNKLVTDETEVTDAALITALNALTKGPLQYFRKLEITTINELENEPIFTRDEEANMTDQALVQWDAAAAKAKTIPMPTMNNQALTAQVSAVVTTVYRDEDNNYYDNDVNPTTRPSGTAGTPVLVPEPADIAQDYEGLGFIKYAGNVSEDIPAGFYYFDTFGALYKINKFEPFTTELYGVDEAGIVEEETWNLPNHGCVKVYSVGFSNNQTTYQWKSNVGGGGLSFVGTRAQYNVAKLIPEGSDGYIGPNTLVTITDEDDYVSGDER